MHTTVSLPFLRRLHWMLGALLAIAGALHSSPAQSQTVPPAWAKGSTLALSAADAKGQRLDVASLRKKFGEGFIIGVSCYNDFERARQAAARPA